MKFKNLMERALSKMVIKAYADRNMSGRPTAEMAVMYNPDSIELAYQSEYVEDEFINQSEVTSQFSGAVPGALNLELVFDAKLPDNTKPISYQLDKLREICCEVDSATAEPRFLRVEWGKMNWNGHGYFAGRMTSLTVRYTLFDRDATPLRAVAALSLIADESMSLQQAKQGKLAPKKRALTALAKSTLPMIASAAAVGGAMGMDYLKLASSNNLDHLNDYAPGKQLVVTSEQGKS